MVRLNRGREGGRLVLVLFLMLAVIAAFPLTASAAETEVTVGELRADATAFIHNAYLAGEPVDPYTAWVLTKAGEDLDSARWTMYGRSLQDQVLALSDLLSDQNTLLTYIVATQNKDGSFGPFANALGTKVPLEALAAVSDDLAGSEDDMVEEAMDRAVDYFGSRYEKGEFRYDATGDGLDYRCVEALALAGENLSVGRWVYEGTSLHEHVLDGVSDAVYNRESEDTVILGKHLSVLTAVYPESADVPILAETVAGRQNDDGGFTGSIFSDVVVLTALGKSGGLELVNTASALQYLLRHKQDHRDMFGNEAGWAWGATWGGTFHEMPDLTAQVLTALSYFPGADDPDSEVGAAIQNGLLYLCDIQDPDTAGISMQGDSTFATAETLLALKRLGKEYAGPGSIWTKKSRTKTVAQCLLAADAWEDDGRRDRLVGILKGRQIKSGSGAGSFENSIYSDVWAFMALGEALSPGEYASMVDKTCLLTKQDPESGAWGEKYDGVFWADFLSTTQALKCMYYLPDAAVDDDIQDAVSRALHYLKQQQQENGAVWVTPWDDPAVDNSAVVTTLIDLGLDPMGDEWTVETGGERAHPVSYLMTGTRNSDGSFGSAGNLFGATQTLLALTYLDPGFAWTVPEPNGPGTVIPVPDLERVDVAVVGQGELLFGPGRVFIDEDNPWGYTALGALDATGLDYNAGGNGFVSSIAGLANSGLNGWMYKVNDSVPAAPAHQKRVSKGDRVIWWYSDDPYSTGPDWADLEDGVLIPVEEELPVEAAEELTVLKTALEALIDGIRPAGITVIAGEPMSEAERNRLREQLVNNTVRLRQSIPVEGGLVAGESLEAGVWIGPDSLSAETEITVDELRPDAVAGEVPLGRRLASGVYEFGPEGLSTADPALLFIRVAADEDVPFDNLTIARWSPEHGNWEILPAVYDPGTGLAGVGVSHFSRYAGFLPADGGVEVQQVPWAEEAVRSLIPRGLFSGMDQPVDIQRPVTRGEFAGWLVRTFGFAPGDSEAAVFADVTAEHPWVREIGAAAGTGLVRGYGDGTFRPEQILTRQDMAALLIRALELLEPAASVAEPDPEIRFVDADRVAAWAKSSMNRAVALNLIRGYPGDRLAPRDNCTRVQALAVLWRLAERLESPEPGLNG